MRENHSLLMSGTMTPMVRDRELRRLRAAMFVT